MKLATYRDGSRDGQLVVVSRDLQSAHYATGIAHKLQQVGILLLRHGAASGGVGLGQCNEAVFLGRKENHLFGPSAQMQGK